LIFHAKYPLQGTKSVGGPCKFGYDEYNTVGGKMERIDQPHLHANANKISC